MHRTHVAAILLLTLFAFITVGYIERLPHTEDATRSLSVTIEIAGIRPLSSAKVLEGTTALALLKLVAEEEKIPLEEKTYAGLGTLVEAIGTLKNGTGGKYWTYTVNNAFAPVGADSYILKNDDAIAWEFDVPEEF